jgi:transcriptional regulator with XRE-family HTH domain
MNTFRELRVKAGFTLAELSEVSGVRQETISKIESGNP